MNDCDDHYVLKRKNAIEDRPFTDPIVQSLFHTLCKKWLGDALDVCFLTRSEWEKKGAGGSKTLFIPEDVTPSEMEKILETAGKPKGARITRRFLESPKNALANFLFEKELDLLLEKLPLPYGRLPSFISRLLPLWKPGQKTLKETGLIETFRAELEEVKKTGNIRLIAGKELDIADKVQMVVREYPPLSNCQHAVEIIKNGARNCRGASLLTIALLYEGIGVRCLIGDLPKHSMPILFLSDDTLVWQDMMAPIFNETITPETIGGVSKNGTPLTYADVIAYARDPTPDGLMIDIIDTGYREKLSYAIKEGQRQFLTLFPPILGSQMQVLNGIAFELANLGYEEKKKGDRGPTRERYYFRQAVEACKLSTGYDPKYEYAYNTMGNALHELGECEEAIDAYQKSFEVNPMNASCHYGLGRANFVLGRRNASLTSYEKYLELADPETEAFWINKAKEKIAILKKRAKK